MRKGIAIAVCALLLALATAASAGQMTKGSLKGPYLDLQFGLTQATFDTDQTTGVKQGENYEPTFGFIFGWNLVDWFSAEINGRYATTRTDNGREHIAGANLFAKFTWISDWLTDFPTFRVLPYAKAGIGTHIAILPGALGGGDSKITSFGYGPSAGGGIAFIWKKYFHFGVDAQCDMLFFDDGTQTVNGVPGTVVYKGGFYPSLVAMGFLGVHY
jgi:hypothetical protein